MTLTRLTSRWGPSSGAISTALQMVTNGGDTEGLFRGAIMNAGSPIPTGDITHQQPYYDTIVEHAGCANATDTLDCLRHVPTETLVAAAGTIPNLFDYPVSHHVLRFLNYDDAHAFWSGSCFCLGFPRRWSILGGASSTSRPLRKCREDSHSDWYADTTVSIYASRAV